MIPRGQLASPAAPAVVVLGGERGSGRSYLCEVAAERARERGLAVALWQLDLAGFDPDAEHALADYLQHLEKQQEARQTFAAMRHKVRLFGSAVVVAE